MAKELVLSLLAVWVLHISHNGEVYVFVLHGFLDEQVVLVVSMCIHECEHALNNVDSLLLGKWSEDVHSKYLVYEMLDNLVHLRLANARSSLLFVEIWNLLRVHFLENRLVVWFVKTTHVTETWTVVEEIKLFSWFFVFVRFYFTFFLIHSLLTQ